MIWVVGANGMLGSEVVRQLADKNIPFVSSGREIDITVSENIENFIKTTESKSYIYADSRKHDAGKIKWIINCAAYTAVEKAEEDRDAAYKLNVAAVENLAHVCRFNNIKLIHISTDYVFDGSGSNPITETNEKNPLSVYGSTKSQGEDAITQSMTQYYILRTSWLYGYNRPNFVYTMIKLMNEKEQIKVINDQFVTPTFTGDLAESIIKLILKSDNSTSFLDKNSQAPFGIYNFSNEGSTTWFEFAQKIYALGKKCKRITNNCNILPCTTQEYGSKVQRPAYSVLSKDKITRELHIKIPTWEKSLEKFLRNKNF